MNIHPCHIGFAITLYHAQELPTVPLIKVSMVGDQIGRGNALGPQVCDSHIQQRSSDALTTMTFFRVHGTNIRGLICQIQEYVDGAYIYIPRKPGTRHAWGQETDYKAELKVRNDRIRSDYATGTSVTALSRRYHLSEKSIRRILQKS